MSQVALFWAVDCTRKLALPSEPPMDSSIAGCLACVLAKAMEGRARERASFRPSVERRLLRVAAMPPENPA